MKKIFALYKRFDGLIRLQDYNIGKTGAGYFGIVSGLMTFALYLWLLYSLPLPYIPAFATVVGGLVFGIMRELCSIWYARSCENGRFDPKAPTRYGSYVFSF